MHEFGSRAGLVTGTNLLSVRINFSPIDRDEIEEKNKLHGNRSHLLL